MTHNTKEVVKNFKKKKKIAIKRNNTINLNLTEQLRFRDIEIESSNFSILIQCEERKRWSQKVEVWCQEAKGLLFEIVTVEHKRLSIGIVTVEHKGLPSKIVIVKHKGLPCLYLKP